MEMLIFWCSLLGYYRCEVFIPALLQWLLLRSVAGAYRSTGISIYMLTRPGIRRLGRQPVRQRRIYSCIYAARQHMQMALGGGRCTAAPCILAAQQHMKTRPFASIYASTHPQNRSSSASRCDLDFTAVDVNFVGCIGSTLLFVRAFSACRNSIAKYIFSLDEQV